MAVKPLTEALARQFGLKTTRKGGPEYVLPPDPTPEAIEIARLNAAKPVEEGGLGLPLDNTSIDRARAMGYRIPFYHGSGDELTKINPLQGQPLDEYNRMRGGAGTFGATDPPEVAELYAPQRDGVVYPLIMRDDAMAKVTSKESPAKVGVIDFGEQQFSDAENLILELPDGRTVGPPNLGDEVDITDYRLGQISTDELIDLAEDYGLDSIASANVKDLGPFFRSSTAKELETYGYRDVGGTQAVVRSEGQVRAPNAAFDPAQRGSPSLTASVDPITAGGILSLIASGGKEALDYLQQNLDPRTIADYGLAITAMTPTPLALPALATESALFASDVVNALRNPETRQQIQDFVTKEGTPSTSGQMKRAVNYQNGGPVDPQDDLFPETIKEGIGTLIEYVPKAAKFVGRGVGDLVRSEPVSPPELATKTPPMDQLDFIAGFSPVYSHNIPAIAGKVVDQLYDPSQTMVNRSDLFIIPEKMGETAPRISKKELSDLLNDIRQQIEVQNIRLDVQGKEAGVTPSPELKESFSQRLVVDRLVDFIRNETGVKDPDQLQRMVTETVMTTTSKLDPKGMADGGVVSLKDRAVNMNRGPRSNGIMQYVPYMTGATNGY